MADTVTVTYGGVPKAAMVVTDGGPAAGSGTTTTAPNATAVQPAISGTSPATGNFTAAAGSPYLTGAGASAGISAAFVSIPSHAMWIKLRGGNPGTAGTPPGTFTGTVEVQRSTDTGLTWDPLTIGGSVYARFTAPCQEAVSAEDDGGVMYRVVCTAYTAGPIYFQIGHK